MPNQTLCTEKQLIAAAARADTNRDGQVDFTEAYRLSESAMSPASKVAATLLNNAVVSASGTFSTKNSFSIDEVVKGVGHAFRAMDYDKNGTLNQSEVDFSQTAGQRITLFGHHFGSATYPQYLKENAAKYR